MPVFNYIIHHGLCLLLITLSTTGIARDGKAAFSITPSSIADALPVVDTLLPRALAVVEDCFSCSDTTFGGMVWFEVTCGAPQRDFETHKGGEDFISLFINLHHSIFFNTNFIPLYRK
ncbi:hypothetical protein ACOSQ4_004701 [Xanthoceras sorbifolium]